MKDSLPFKEEKICERVFNRKFFSHTPKEEFKWHTDGEDRIIIPLCENNWKFQLDNQLPIKIDSPIKVKKGEWHRLIKGSGDLYIRVIKL